MINLVLLCIILFGASGVACAQHFAGKYTGDISGAETILSLNQKGTAISGNMVSGPDGYTYTISGNVTGKTATGTLTDPNIGTPVDVELVLTGDNLTVTLLYPNPQTGQKTPIPLQFVRAGTAAGPNRTSPAAPASNLDRVLIGRWVKNTSMTSGDFSVATQEFMEFRADGTLRIGDGRMAGGGDAGSFSTGAGDTYTGKWRAQNGNLSVFNPATNQWTVISRYHVEDNKMLLIDLQGNREIWYRH